MEMEQFISSFIEEARSLLYQLESDLLLLEKESDNNEIINSIFRVMHSLKGAAGMYGFKNIQNLTHEFESIYDEIRGGRLKVTTGLIDATLKGKDLLLSMLEKNYSKEESQTLIKFLKNEYNNETFKETKAVDTQSENRISGPEDYFILFSPDKAVFERGIDPDVAIDEITNLGKVKIILHEKKTSWASQKAKKICNTSWEIYLRSSVAKTEVEEIFLFFDHDEFSVFKTSEDSLKDDPEYLTFFNKYYKDKGSVSEHLAKCFHGLIIPDKIIAGNEAAQVSNENHPENKTADLSKLDVDSTINVSSQKLDELLNLVSELVTSTAALETYAEKFKDIKLKNTIEYIEKLTKRFRNNALDLRLLPVGTLLDKFNRHVRDLSKELNKKVNLIIEGHDTEIDKTILKSIESPLLHIIRNSIDHGIESSEERLKKGKTAEGLLKIVAFYSGANVIIQVQDDGAGINLERVKECAIKKGYMLADQQVTDQELLNMIMEPGFTTSDNISMVSGRGVGMDVVRKQLNSVSGSLEIDTEKDLGTFITMKLPTTLSIIDTLMIEVNKSQLLIPLLDIEYCYKEKRSALFDNDSRYIRYKNDMVPFISLREKFKYQDQLNEEEMVIVINKFEKKYAIVVDHIVGEHQAVIKPLGEIFVNQPYFSGGSIMVDGKLALILDTNYLFNQIVIN
jgi:two-component system, chemotaxis family, sensor kinase CheA